MKSLQQRLLLGLVISVTALMGLLWWLANGAMNHLGEDFVLSRLEHDAENLLGAIQVDDQGNFSLRVSRVGAIYQQPLSGHYYVVENEKGVALLSRSFWDVTLKTPMLQHGEVLHWHTTGPAAQPLMIWSGGFQKQGQLFTVSVAEDMLPLKENLASFNRYFAGLTLLVLGLILFVQRQIVRQSLKSLAVITREIRDLQQGELGELSDNVPAEVRPLVREVNHLLRLLTERLQRSRNAMGNLAHALKQPLNVLAQLSRQPSVAQAPELAQQLNQHTEMIRQLVDRELKRARLVGAGAPGQRFVPQDEMPVLIDLLQRIYASKDQSSEDAGLKIHWQAPEDGSYHFDRDDMLELIGNLLDNACKYARHEVSCRLSGEDNYLRLVVEDDGPGCSDEEINQLTQRGVRIDESGPGHGLGLAIVKDIVEQYQGVLAFGRSTRLGGLSVSVSLGGKTDAPVARAE